MTKKQKKVFLITPPYHCGVVEVAGRWMPLAFAYLAGSLRRAGYDVRIYDAMSKFHTHDDIIREIKAAKPDVVAVTAITPTLNDAIAVLGNAKNINEQIITVIGGVHPTFCPEELLSRDDHSIDFVIRGEGEAALVELLDALTSGGDLAAIPGLAFMRDGAVVKNEDRPFFEDLDSLEAAWDLLDWEDYVYYVVPKSRLAVVSSSRGCSEECAFCSQQKFWKRTWRGRSPEKFVEEIKMLNKKYGANVFLICDEFPTKDRERWEEILDRLIEANTGAYLLMETRVDDIIRDAAIMDKYRRAGVIHIYIGVEATSQTTLDRFNKNLAVEKSREAISLINAAGMITETSFILGLPEETKQTVAATLELAKYYNPDFAHFLALTPWPYADMYESLSPYIVDHDFSNYNLVTPVIKPEKMTVRQVDREIVNCYRKFYMSRLSEYDGMEDAFKRNYLLTSMKVMMKSSFLTRYLKGLGKMPVEVERILNKGQGGQDA